MKRVTLLVDEVERLGDAYAVRIGDERPLYVHERHVASVEDVPDPLPTAPGTVIEAKITYTDGIAPQYVERARFHLLPGFGDTAVCPWRSERELYGSWWHRPAVLSDWTVVYAPDGAS